ncbi:hypothetical protein SLS56_000679 [Neofusicoccum ribis]|uniref:Uncharacterized protein n=1 Tax=Neofusicoccum ribis TaxID=45134 RepID=A0ABR3TDP8_9PEZI
MSKPSRVLMVPAPVVAIPNGTTIEGLDPIDPPTTPDQHSRQSLLGLIFALEDLHLTSTPDAQSRLLGKLPTLNKIHPFENLRPACQRMPFDKLPHSVRARIWREVAPEKRFPGAIQQNAFALMLFSKRYHAEVKKAILDTTLFVVGAPEHLHELFRAFEKNNVPSIKRMMLALPHQQYLSIFGYNIDTNRGICALPSPHVFLFACLRLETLILRFQNPHHNTVTWLKGGCTDTILEILWKSVKPYLFCTQKVLLMGSVKRFHQETYPNEHHTDMVIFRRQSTFTTSSASEGRSRSDSSSPTRQLLPLSTRSRRMSGSKQKVLELLQMNDEKSLENEILSQKPFKLAFETFREEWMWNGSRTGRGPGIVQIVDTVIPELDMGFESKYNGEMGRQNWTALEYSAYFVFRVYTIHQMHGLRLCDPAHRDSARWVVEGLARLLQLLIYEYLPSRRGKLARLAEEYLPPTKHLERKAAFDRTQVRKGKQPTFLARGNQVQMYLNGHTIIVTAEPDDEIASTSTQNLPRRITGATEE